MMVGASHTTAPLELLGRLSIPSAELRAALSQVAGMSEVLVAWREQLAGVAYIVLDTAMAAQFSARNGAAIMCSGPIFPSTPRDMIPDRHICGM